MEQTHNPFGRTLAVLRVHNGISRSELATAAGISYPYYSEIETGKKEPTLAVIRRLAAALKIPVSELFRLEERFAAGHGIIWELIA